MPKKTWKLNSEFSAAITRIFKQHGTPDLCIIALSGGVDSVVLLDLVLALRAEGGLRGVRLTAAHLNHCLRGADADGDAAFCRRLCADGEVECVVRRADAAAAARNARIGTEEAGRQLRYAFFADIAGTADALVLTAHHADDQAETILLHLRRGAARRGLGGMRELTHVPAGAGRIAVGRPLLGVPKRALQDYAVARGLHWRQDATNADCAYQRNRIRCRTLPLLERWMPGFTAALLRRAAEHRHAEAEHDARAAGIIRARASHECGGVFFRAVAGDAPPREDLYYALRQLTEEQTGARVDSTAVLDRLAALLDAPVGRAVMVCPTLTVRREPDGLFFFAPGRPPAAPELELPAPPFDIAADGVRAQARLLPAPWPLPQADRADPHIQWLDPGRIRGPLVLRRPRQGERFVPLGAPGGRKIQDILTDLRVPRRKRSMRCLLADAQGGLWLWPYRLGQRASLAGPCPMALRLTLYVEEP